MVAVAAVGGTVVEVAAGADVAVGAAGTVGAEVVAAAVIAGTVVEAALGVAVEVGTVVATVVAMAAAVGVSSLVQDTSESAASKPTTMMAIDLNLVIIPPKISLTHKLRRNNSEWIISLIHHRVGKHKKREPALTWLPLHLLFKA